MHRYVCSRIYETATLLSYRHGYHAGNHADVFKHIVLCLLLKKLTAKATPCIYLDTHAGAGSYNLNQQWAQRNAEFLQGIERLLEQEQPPALAADLLQLVRNARRQGPMAYPGSPAIARELLRPQDKLVLMELHNNEISALKRNCHGDKRISFHHRDGFEGLVGLMPPAIARGLVLVDPSYELKADYERTATSVVKAAGRWSTGTFAVWYPLLGKDRNRSQPLLQRLKSGAQNLLVSELWVKAPSEDFGMHGSGMAIINPPWQLDTQLQELIPPLSALLAQDDQAGWRVDWLKAKA
jgi:23S rRNA (adenine2030-N6)-methyltransferase